VSPLAERSVASLDREELQTVSERWRQTRGIKDREMTFLTRPATLDDEIDVRKFFSFDQEGRLQAFAFFDPIQQEGRILGYLCSAKRFGGIRGPSSSPSNVSRRGKSDPFPWTLAAMRH
jgi:hypothetical protein